ncbi:MULTISPECIES: hypothetical protein [Heyndrickxia]|uniref:hypothetical protein n=1 Tax=Heyndrickxia TaxID=2837504 RepID=UPI002E1FC132|nr:hypothetical protein [Weizmannia sp. CD-2023]
MTVRPNFGDIVHVAGYQTRLFQVDGYRTEHWHYPDEEWINVVYELTDVQTSEWLDADIEDLTIVAPATDAAKFLATLKPAGLIILREDTPMLWSKPEPPTPSARELAARKVEEKRREIDALLDEYNDTLTLVALFGGLEYAEKLAEIKRKLADASRKE